jgi:hypothetical protein
MIVLGTLGLGHRLHETVFALLQGVALVAVVALLVARAAGRRPKYSSPWRAPVAC